MVKGDQWDLKAAMAICTVIGCLLAECCGYIGSHFFSGSLLHYVWGLQGKTHRLICRKMLGSSNQHQTSRYCLREYN